MRWWQFDVTGITIRLFEKLGLMWDVQAVTIEAEDAHQSRSQQLQQSFFEMRDTMIVSITLGKAELGALWKLYKSRKPEDKKEIKKMYKTAMKRLKTIEHFISSVPTVRRQKMKQYSDEVSKVVESTILPLRQRLQLS
jgi:hypothetical protein